MQSYRPSDCDRPVAAPPCSLATSTGNVSQRHPTLFSRPQIRRNSASEGRNSAPRPRNRVSLAPCTCHKVGSRTRTNIAVSCQRRRLRSSMREPRVHIEGLLDFSAHTYYNPCTLHLDNPIDTHLLPTDALSRLSHFRYRLAILGRKPGQLGAPTPQTADDPSYEICTIAQFGAHFAEIALPANSGPTVLPANPIHTRSSESAKIAPHHRASVPEEFRP